MFGAFIPSPSAARVSYTIHIYVEIDVRLYGFGYAMYTW